MTIDILTLFPQMFDGFLNTSIIKRAIEDKKVKINIHNIRDYSPYKNKQVDDYPYGGGAGMILMCEPIFNAIESIKTKESYVIMLTPSGKTFNQKQAKELINHKHIILLCGHYEGFDERIKTIIDLELSVGDFILTGGEIPSMLITDCITRLIPGVINNQSLEDESFNNNLLDYPNYTRPYEFRKMKVPDVLISGHHENIKKYRQEEQLKITKEKRPDLIVGEENEK